MGVIGPLVFGVLFGGVGTLLTKQALRERRQGRELEATAVTPAGAVREGIAEVEGAVSVADESLTTPFSEEPAVLCAWTIERRDRDDDAHKWNTLETGLEAVPFLVSDDSDEIAVDPTPLHTRHDAAESDGVGAIAAIQSGALDLEDGDATFSIESPIDEIPSTAIESFAADEGTNVTEANRRRYRERRIRPGDDLFVHGEAVPAHETATAASNLVITDGPNAELLLADQPKETLSSERSGLALYGKLLAGVVFGLVGAAALAVAGLSLAVSVL